MLLLGFDFFDFSQVKLFNSCSTYSMFTKYNVFYNKLFSNFFSAIWAKETSSISIDSIAVKSPRQELQSVISQIERENRYNNTIKYSKLIFEIVNVRLIRKLHKFKNYVIE